MRMYIIACVHVCGVTCKRICLNVNASNFANICLLFKNCNKLNNIIAFITYLHEKKNVYILKNHCIHC